MSGWVVWSFVALGAVQSALLLRSIVQDVRAGRRARRYVNEKIARESTNDN